MTNKKLKIAITLAVFSMVGAAHAQIRPAYQYPPDSSREGGVKLGASFFLTPYVGLAVGRDDNLFLSPNNEKSSTYWLLSPGFSLDGRGTNSVLQFKYQAQMARYSQSEDDNYIDHTGRAIFDLAIDRRNFLRLGLDLIRAHDPRGSTDRPISGDPDKYKQISPNATYAFGAPGAAGRVEVYGSVTERRYTNNHETTRVSERDLREFGGAFYWRVAPKTYVLAEARHTDISYRVRGVGDGDEWKYYGGISWEATAATTGTFKVGRLQRDSDVGGAEMTSTGWEGSVVWAPRTYSRFDFYTARQTNESTGLGRFILSSIGGVSWAHAWTSVFSTGVDLRYQKDQYQGFNRTDEIKTVGLKAGYKFRRWLTLGAEVTHATRDSNQSAAEYDKNLYLLTATASM